jgi:DNA-binding CsgD family transcriptional regulator
MSEPIQGVFTDLFEAERTPPVWVIEDLLPAGLTWLAGPPKKAQKSTMMLGMSLLVAGYKAKVFPAHMQRVARDGKVIIISAEATAGMMRFDVEERMGVRAASVDGILVADDPWKFRLDRPDGKERLQDWAERLQPRVLVFDPFRNLHSQSEKDEGALLDLLGPWREWAIKNDAALLVLHHVRKPSEDQTEYTVKDLRGSGALDGMCDGSLIVTPKNGFHHIKAQFKRAAPWERDLILGVDGQTAKELVSDGDKKVLKLLTDGATQDEMAAALNKSKSYVSETVKKLERTGYVTKKGTRWEATK